MTVRRPIVIIDGDLKELPTGDSVPGTGGDDIGAGPSLVPMTTGEEPLVLMSDGQGQCLMAPVAS